MQRKNLFILIVALAAGAGAWIFRAQLFGEARASRALIADLALAQVDGDPALERIVLWRSDRHPTDPQSLIEAIDQDGAPRWTQSLPSAQSVRVCGETVVVGLRDADDAAAQVVALDSKTGQRRWQWRRETATGRASPALVACDPAHVHVQVGEMEIGQRAWHALDLQTGAERWSLPAMQHRSAPIALGASLISLLHGDERLGVAVDPRTGAASDIPAEAWPDGGGQVRGVQREGDRLVGVAFSDRHDGCVLVTWGPSDRVWQPALASSDLNCRPAFGRLPHRLTPRAVLTVLPDGRQIVALSRKDGARIAQAANPKPPPVGSRVALAPPPAGRLDRVISTRFAPLLLIDDGAETRYQIVVFDTEGGQIAWASDWFAAPRIDHGGRLRHGGVTWFQVQTGAEQAAWLGIDGATGRAVGAWGYHFEGTGEAPPQHEEIPRIPRAEDWDGDTLHTYYWVTAVGVDVTSGAAGWRQSSYGGGKGVVEDRRAAVERRVGSLP